MFIIENRKIFFLISGFLVLGSILAVSILGLHIGIDFKGGSLLEINYLQGRPELLLLIDNTKKLDLGEVVFQPTGDNSLIIKN